MSSADNNRRSVLPAAAARLVSFALSYIISQTPVLSSLYPFGTAYIASLGRGNMLAAMLGSMLSGVFVPENRLRIAASALAAGGIRWTLSELRGLDSKPLYPAAAAFFSAILGGLADSDVRAGLWLTAVVPLLYEAVSSAFCAYLFSQCFSSLRLLNTAAASLPENRLPGGVRSYFHMLPVRMMSTQFYGLGTLRQAACIFTAGVFSIPLCRITVGGVSPFSAVLLLAACLCARMLPPSKACLGGVASGLVLSLSSGNIVYTGICACAALLSSLMAPYSALAAAGIFSASCAALCLRAGSIDIYFAALSVVACSICAALPDRMLDMFRPAPAADDDEETESEPPAPPPGGAREAASALRRAARGLEDISSKAIKVSEKLDEIDIINYPQSIMLCAKDVCRDCGISSFCWGERAERTQSEIASACGRLLKGEDIPDRLLFKCARRSELIDRLRMRYYEYAERERINRRVMRVRSVTAVQTSCASRLLEQVADRLDRSVIEENMVPARIRSAVLGVLAEYAPDPYSVRMTRGTGGRFCLSLNADVTEDDAVLDEMVFALSGALGWELDVSEDKPANLLHIRRCAPLTTVFGACRRSRDGSLLCGDAYETMLLDSGHAVYILSDGMGTGGRAAIDASMTCAMLSRMLSAGFDLSGAMGMVNCALMLRAEDESISTVDCVSIDLFNGRAVLQKAGAASSFVIRRGKVGEVSIGSLPLGIIDRVDSSSEELSLRAGDVVLMVSDGVTGVSGGDWIKSLLSDFYERGGPDGGDLRELACSIVRSAPGAGLDDVTAIAVRLERRGAPQKSLTDSRT